MLLLQIKIAKIFYNILANKFASKIINKKIINKIKRKIKKFIKCKTDELNQIMRQNSLVYLQNPLPIEKKPTQTLPQE
jgi:hypothetical protein